MAMWRTKCRKMLGCFNLISIQFPTSMRKWINADRSTDRQADRQRVRGFWPKRSWTLLTPNSLLSTLRFARHVSSVPILMCNLQRSPRAHGPICMQLLRTSLQVSHLSSFWWCRGSTAISNAFAMPQPRCLLPRFMRMHKFECFPSHSSAIWAKWLGNWASRNCL